jgi:hypothetical protein
VKGVVLMVSKGEKTADEKEYLIEKGFDRKTWMFYIMGYLISAGFKIPRVYVKSFKHAFPEVPDELIEQIVKE